jgi:hypothetical protein
MNWTMSKMEAKTPLFSCYAWFLLLFQSKNRGLPSILTPMWATRLPEPKQNARRDAIRSSSSSQEEEQPWTPPSWAMTPADRRHRKRRRPIKPRDCSGKGEGETYSIEAEGISLRAKRVSASFLRRFGSPVLALAIDSSRLALFFLLFISEERRGRTCVCMCCWVCLARESRLH